MRAYQLTYPRHRLRFWRAALHPAALCHPNSFGGASPERGENPEKQPSGPSLRDCCGFEQEAQIRYPAVLTPRISPHKIFSQNTLLKCTPQCEITSLLKPEDLLPNGWGHPTK